MTPEIVGLYFCYIKIKGFTFLACWQSELKEWFAQKMLQNLYWWFLIFISKEYDHGIFFNSFRRKRIWFKWIEFIILALEKYKIRLHLNLGNFKFQTARKSWEITRKGGDIGQQIILIPNILCSLISWLKDFY